MEPEADTSNELLLVISFQRKIRGDERERKHGKLDR